MVGCHPRCDWCWLNPSSLNTVFGMEYLFLPPPILWEQFLLFKSFSQSGWKKNCSWLVFPSPFPPPPLPYLHLSVSVRPHHLYHIPLLCHQCLLCLCQACSCVLLGCAWEGDLCLWLAHHQELLSLWGFFCC